MSKRPHRLPAFSYLGLHRYSLTFCTLHLVPTFVVEIPVNRAREQIQQACADHTFAGIAYCFMPDHLHLLAVGTSNTSDLVAFAHAVKQRTSYAHRRTHPDRLWQKGYYEHVLRSDQATLAVARYILENP